MMSFVASHSDDDHLCRWDEPVELIHVVRALGYLDGLELNIAIWLLRIFP